MESGIQTFFSCESGILVFGVQNPANDWKAKSIIWDPESKTVLDYLKWGSNSISLNGSHNWHNYAKWGELTMVVLKKSVTYILKTKGRCFSLFMVVTLERDVCELEQIP